MKDFYMVKGEYDLIILLDAPDDASLAKAVLTASSSGSISSETYRAFSEAEYHDIIGGLP